MGYEETESESEPVELHVPCTNPECGSSDGMTVYSDGHTYCFVCATWSPGTGEYEHKERPKMTSKDLIPYNSLILEPLKVRGITAETCRKFGYYKSRDKGKPVQVACIYDDSGAMIGQKVRTKDKDFYSYGKVGDRFVGQHLWPGGGKKLVVTEGEIDMLSVSQVQGNKWPVVSLPNGSKSAKKAFKAQLEWLESFEEVITMFDMDAPGQEARESVEGLLSPHKLKHATLPRKDANECLLNGDADKIIQAIWNAKVYKPGGIVNGADLWQKLNEKKAKVETFAWPWNIDLQKLTRGIRMGEMLMLTAGTGIGKSTIFRELAYHFGVVMEDPIKVGMIFLEEPDVDTALGVMSLHVNRRLHLEWDETTEEERKAAFDATMGTGRFIFYDHFGSLDGESLINKIRYMATAEGCKVILLDHISIAISGLDSNNERKDIDVLMTNLASLIQETGVGIGVICHLKKTEKKEDAFEEGGRISLDDLRGSGTLKQIPNTIVAGERNQQAEDTKEKNLVRIRLLKCRFTGETGIAGYLYFNKDTGRLEQVDRVSDYIERSIDMNEDEESDY